MLYKSQQEYDQAHPFIEIDSKALGIVLTKGQVVVFDKSDEKLIRGYRWYLRLDKSRRTFRAETYFKKNGDVHRIMMEWLICRTHKEVDHIDGNGRNNRRANLRKATKAQNQQNRRKFPSARYTSRFKGVYQNKRTGKWCALIRKEHLGTFSTEEEAALAYNKAAKRLFGEFARLNVVEIVAA